MQALLSKVKRTRDCRLHPFIPPRRPSLLTLSLSLPLTLLPSLILSLLSLFLSILLASPFFPFYVQAFINTAAKIYQKIQDGVFDVSNEV